MTFDIEEAVCRPHFFDIGYDDDDEDNDNNNVFLLHFEKNRGASGKKKEKKRKSFNTSLTSPEPQWYILLRAVQAIHNTRTHGQTRRHRTQLTLLRQ